MRKCPEVHGGHWLPSWEDSAPLSSACSAAAVTGALEGGIHEADEGGDGGSATVRGAQGFRSRAQQDKGHGREFRGHARFQPWEAGQVPRAKEHRQATGLA